MSWVTAPRSITLEVIGMRQRTPARCRGRAIAGFPGMGGAPRSGALGGGRRCSPRYRLSVSTGVRRKGPPMVRWIAAAALLVGTGAAEPAWAGDVEACGKAEMHPALALLWNDAARRVAACRRLAEQGDATGQFNLGAAYYVGQCVPNDDAEAARWIEKAANGGLAVAQYNLGLLYQL